MEIHQIRYFLAVAETGSFTRASERCYVSQPSLSSQIAKLEGELGGALFERGRQGARLTAWGHQFLPRAAEILLQLERVRVEFQELAGLQRGSVTLGCLPTTGAYLLPPLLTAFQREYPQIQVQLTEESSPNLGKALREGRLDLAILDEAGLVEGLESRILFSEPLLVACPRSHPFASRGSIPLGALAGEPLILMKSGHGFRRIMLSSLEAAGVDPRVVYESGGIETVQALVEAGLGLSLVPLMVCRQKGPAYLTIEPPTPSRSLFLAWREGMSSPPATQALMDKAQEVLKGGVRPPGN